MYAVKYTPNRVEVSLTMQIFLNQCIKPLYDSDFDLLLVEGQTSSLQA